MSAAQELINKGLKKGLKKGRKEGREEGREEGLRQGRQKLLDLAVKVFADEELQELRKLDDLNELSDRVKARIDERLAGS